MKLSATNVTTLDTYLEIAVTCSSSPSKKTRQVLEQ